MLETNNGKRPSANAESMDVQALAYRYWQERGCPDGCPEDDWFRAEQELSRRSDDLNPALKEDGIE